MNLKPRIGELLPSMNYYAALCQVAGENDMTVGQVNKQLKQERDAERELDHAKMVERETAISEQCAAAWWQD